MRGYKKFKITYAVIIVSFAGSLLLPCGMSGPGLPANNNNKDSADISNVHLMTYEKIYSFIFLSVTYTINVEKPMFSNVSQCCVNQSGYEYCSITSQEMSSQLVFILI